MEERNFDCIKILPEEIMTFMVQQGDVSLSQYMQWLMTDRSWKSVKEVLMENLIDITKDNK
jgi:hypothetical protein